VSVVTEQGAPVSTVFAETPVMPATEQDAPVSAAVAEMPELPSKQDAPVSSPVAEMPNVPAARPAAAAGNGSKQAARLQAAFEHSEERAASADEQRRPQEPRPPPRQRQWRDRGWGAGRHAQQPEARLQVSSDCHASQ